MRDDIDRDKWVELLRRCVDDQGWKVFAFALMTNHYHLFLQTPEPNLSAGMHRLNGSFAGCFHARHAAYLARLTTNAPGRAIAARLGYRSASSVSVACRRVQSAAEHRGFAEELARLRQGISTDH